MLQVYLGPPNIEQYLPAPKSIVSAHDFASPKGRPRGPRTPLRVRCPLLPPLHHRAVFLTRVQSWRRT